MIGFPDTVILELRSKLFASERAGWGERDIVL